MILSNFHFFNLLFAYLFLMACLLAKYLRVQLTGHRSVCLTITYAFLFFCFELNKIEFVFLFLN